MNSLLILLAISAATPKPIDVAYLVLEKDATAIVEPLRAALASGDPFVRTTAARVAGVRDEKVLVPDLRKSTETEKDATAAREELRSIALLGTDADVDFALQASEKWPGSVTGAVESMIARRSDAFDIYFAKLRGRRVGRDFFLKALWDRRDQTVAISSRLAGLGDASAWRALLGVLRDSDVDLQPGIAVAVLDGPSEEMRNETVWYFLREYARNPDGVPEAVRDAFSNPKEAASDREAFGRELVHRMLGGERKEDPRWLAWLETTEADDLLAYNEPDVFALLTDREFALRKNHCGLLPVECTMPPKPMKLVGRVVGPRPVPAPEIDLPGELPAGLAETVSSRCADLWFGLVNVTVDGAGRVQDLDLSHVNTTCTRELETLLRLSYATNRSIASPRRSNDLIVSRGPRTTPCLDEQPPTASESTGLLARTGGKVVAPKVRRRVEPVYPHELLGTMKASGNVLVIVEAIIAKSGCVRSVRLVAQSQFPQLNTSALFAVSQWTFYPGTLDGKAVDVLYSVTINFKQ